jgi:precorrin-6A/cobalt-precorrin-6A reductase
LGLLSDGATEVSMTVLRILILGGTHEARAIADQLILLGHDVITSLAGVTTSPILPSGKIRIGGFGGVEGLVKYLRSEKIDVLVDATHPFAAIMSGHAVDAATHLGCRLLRFERPRWETVSGDHWIPVASLGEAAAAVPAEAVVLLTTGRKELRPFLHRSEISGFIRTVEPVADFIPPRWRMILDRPPQELDSEISLMRDNRITHLVTKNAGGDRTRAKLDAARVLGLPVIMIQRPMKPNCETISALPEVALRLGTSGGFG